MSRPRAPDGYDTSLKAPRLSSKNRLKGEWAGLWACPTRVLVASNVANAHRAGVGRPTQCSWSGAGAVMAILIAT